MYRADSANKSGDASENHGFLYFLSNKKAIFSGGGNREQLTPTIMWRAGLCASICICVIYLNHITVM